MMGNDSITVTKDGNVVKTVYNNDSNRWMKFSRNVVTGHYVSRLKGDVACETDLLCDGDMTYKQGAFNTIATVPITSNMILFNELEKLL